MLFIYKLNIILILFYISFSNYLKNVVPRYAPRIGNRTDNLHHMFFIDVLITGERLIFTTHGITTYILLETGTSTYITNQSTYVI